MITADHAISVTLEVTRKLDERELAFIQMALLYTTMKGERRVRVCNVAIPVVALPGSAFDNADMEVVVTHFAREGKHSSFKRFLENFV
jgi:protein transport protein SEC24